MGLCLPFEYEWTENSLLLFQIWWALGGYVRNRLCAQWVTSNPGLVDSTDRHYPGSFEPASVCLQDHGPSDLWCSWSVLGSPQANTPVCLLKVIPQKQQKKKSWQLKLCLGLEIPLVRVKVHFCYRIWNADGSRHLAQLWGLPLVVIVECFQNCITMKWKCPQAVWSDYKPLTSLLLSPMNFCWICFSFKESRFKLAQWPFLKPGSIEGS